MIPSDDVLAGLPAPLDDEPPSVRQDIADELADHLACAYRRELLKTADEPMAQQRVLDRFGDPRRIAYQLWFQALWGRIMLHRFTRVWQGLKVVCGLVALFLIVRMAEQQSALHSQIQFMTANYNAMQSQTMGTRNLLEQVLSRLPQPPQPQAYESAMGGDAGMAMPGSGAMMGMGTGPMMPGTTGIESMRAADAQAGLTIRLTMQGTNDEPASGCLVAVLNEQGESLFVTPLPPESYAGFFSKPGMMGGPVGLPGGMDTLRQSMTNGQSGVPVTPEMKGIVRFRNGRSVDVGLRMEPGRYMAYVEFPDGRQCQHRFVIPPRETASMHEEHIVCPPPAQNAYVVIETDKLPQEFIDAEFSVQAKLNRRFTPSGTMWSSEPAYTGWTLYFDPATGLPTRYYRLSVTDTKTQVVSVYGLPAEQRFLKVSPDDYDVEFELVFAHQKISLPLAKHEHVALTTDSNRLKLSYGEAELAKLREGIREDALTNPNYNSQLLKQAFAKLAKRLREMDALSDPASKGSEAYTSPTPANQNAVKP